MKKNYLAGVFCFFGILLITQPSAFAADYLGAAAVLEKSSQKPPPPTGGEKPSATAQLKQDVEAFKKQSTSLKPEEAAQQWMKLLDRQLNLSPMELQKIAMEAMNGQTTNTFNPRDIWMALPPPEDWDALRTVVEARPAQKETGKAAQEICLKIIAHTLVADRRAQTNDLARLEDLTTNATDNDASMLERMGGQIAEHLLEKSDDPDAIMKSLERRLTGESYQTELSLPNLVPLIGEEKTTAFLRRVFTNSAMQVDVRQGEETEKLARKLALEMVVELKEPQWALAQSVEAGPLFEALEKKFAQGNSQTNETEAATGLDAMINRSKPGQRRENFGYDQARVYYLLYLVSQGRSKEAVVVANKVGSENSVYFSAAALRQLKGAGYVKPIHDFFFELLSQNPDLPFWNEYIELAAETGETEKMLDLARKSAAREDIKSKRKDSIRRTLYSALLAADKVDEGVAEIRQILSQPAQREGESEYETSSGAGLALSLASIGQLMNNTNWVEEGIRLAREELHRAEAETPRGYNSTSSNVKELAEFLFGLGRGPEAESLLSETLVAGQQNTQQSYWGDPASRVYLGELVSIYYRVGRYADVLVLLDGAPGWSARDLADFRELGLDNVHQHEDSIQDSVRHDAAASLMELGRKDEAGKIINALLDDNGGYDPAYETLLKIGGPSVMARLDELFARDQFEERPLIWKAIVLEQNGKLEDAEAAARKAISIDPSDGEQGPGRRMRAYAVLSDIRKARGDEKEADLFHGAVEAIRLSENADRYYRAGLLKQAVSMYEDSLLKFEGAYCIQSRLALRLTELGKHEEAAEHYRRAYELMPDSFGRVESHCFGCEGAFQGFQAQSIANKVFTSLAKSDPQKPQVHYLLGYLREEQGNYAEALTHFRDAVKLDPDYLNAWKHIATVGREYYLSASDRDAVILNTLRLDPLGRHGGAEDIEDVTDLRAVWKAVEVAGRLRPNPAATLYPLPASKAELDKQDNESKRRENYEMMYGNNMRQSIEPAQAVLQNSIIRAAMEFVGGRYGQMID